MAADSDDMGDDAYVGIALEGSMKRLGSLNRKPHDHIMGKYQRNNSSFTHTLTGLTRLRFISRADGAAGGWAAVEKRFDKLTSAANANGLLPRSHFWECIGMNKEAEEFAGLLFDVLRRKRNITGDSIDKAQLKEFWDQMSDQSFHNRLQIFFDMVDKDEDGSITEEEVKEIIIHSASANKLHSIQKLANECAALVMEKLDPKKKGFILLEHLEELLLQAASNTTPARDESKKLKPNSDHNLIRRWYQNSKYFITDNWQRAWVLALWIGVMAGLFAYKYLQYKNKAAFDVMGVCVCLAKGGAETLKLNMALVLLPVCRNTITWLRNKTRLGAAVPFDDNFNFHKLIAVAIGIGVAIHGLAHLACDFPRLLNASPEKYEPMIPYFGEQPKSYWHFVKGTEGVTGIVMVVLMAISFTIAIPWFRGDHPKLPKLVKKLTNFNAFWYSHHFYVIVYALLIVHGIKLYMIHEWYNQTTWMYLAVPIILYAVERLIRAFRSNIRPVKVLKVDPYHEEVLAVHISKPQGFIYKSGQYLFLKCPVVSPFEWHPFSITSAPRDEYLSVHIRDRGDWTKQLLTKFSQVCKSPPTGKSDECLEGGEKQSLDYPEVMIDGPYGAPAQDYQKYEVVLLVGLGIGATPMISIVKDILNNIKATEEEENGSSKPSGTSSPLTQKRGGNFKTQRAYFYWVTKEQGSFDWFKGIINEVAETNQKRIIEVHNYCTSVCEDGDARSALIAMIQSLYHAKNGVDVVSGTRVKSHFAKPCWKNVYDSIAQNHPDKSVGVFYCGAPALAKKLRQLALKFSHETSTKFDFHKENF